MLTKSCFIKPDWPAPANVQAFSTTRLSPMADVSTDSLYPQFNLATHVHDKPEAVQHNRALLREALALPTEPCWLQQVHGVNVVQAESKNFNAEADASFTHEKDRVCIIQTADCLPILFCDKEGKGIAVAHAGWRGLQAGVLENTINAMRLPPENLLAWLGPAISQSAYEIDEAVYAPFVNGRPEAENAFKTTRAGHWQMDIYSLAKMRLQASGIQAIYGGDYCTYTDKERFYSYRRDGETGRMASLIWLS